MNHKIVKLTIHKNTLQKRYDKKMRSNAIKYFKECLNKKDISGYVVAVWDKEGITTSCSHIEKNSPIRSTTLPEHLKTIFLDRFVNS